MVLTHQEWLRDRPCEARQPASYAMVLIPAEKSLEDERRGFVLVASSSFGGCDFLYWG